ncbi:hypothetical protein GVAV_001463 [Gurleya vavrai]
MLLFYFLHEIFQKTIEENFLFESNKYRVQNNHKKLKSNKKLQRAAVDIANFMCTMRTMAIDNNPQLNLTTILKKKRYGDVKECAMNYGSSTGKNYKAILQKWKRNKDKNENLLGDFEETGVAFCKNMFNELYIVQVYALKFNYQ